MGFVEAEKQNTKCWGAEKFAVNPKTILSRKFVNKIHDDKRILTCKIMLNVRNTSINSIHSVDGYTDTGAVFFHQRIIFLSCLR
jgi:hypothetical protein